jgi:UDP-glucose 4-epimerase
MPPARWLITGGCGFIGLNLVKNLLGEGGHYIRILDNLSVGNREDLSQVCNFTEIDPKSLDPQPLSETSVIRTERSSDSSAIPPYSSLSNSADLIVADILNPEFALKAAEGIDIIVHLAANTGVGPSIENPRKDMEANVIGTLNMLEAAKQNNVKRFIFASSGAPIGETEPPIHEEIVPHPVSPYGASKLAGEGYCLAYFKAYGIETVVLRFGNVYGPLSGQKNSVVANFIKRVMRGKPIEIYGDGKQTRDFIYIDDLIRALRLSASRNKIGGEIFQIATNKETTIGELANKLILILAESDYKNIKMLYTSPRFGDVRRNFSDTSKALKHLGWQTEIELFEGLKRTLKWFIENRF